MSVIKRYAMPSYSSALKCAPSVDGPPAVIRTDPAPGFRALVNDPLLKKYRITIKLGQAKNPVAERAVLELETELLRQELLGGVVSPLTLAVATSALNSRIRSRSLSSREMWTQRDQFPNQLLPLADDRLIALQQEQRLSNHPHSQRAKAPVPTSYVFPTHVPDTTQLMETIMISHPRSSLPDTTVAISTSAQHLSNTPCCVTTPIPACPIDHITDDTAVPSCPEDPSLEKIVPLGLRRSSRTRRLPARLLGYDTEL